MNRFLSIALVLVMSTLAAGCQPAVYLMPTPAAISTGDIDPFADTPEEERSGDIKVAYVTNRLPVGARQARYYTRDFDDDLRMGIATIQIGDGGRSWEEIRELSRQGPRKDQILLSLAGVEEIATLEHDASLDALPEGVAAMMADLNEAIDKNPLKDITVYVHGANNNFYRTASQAAQYRHFTGRNAIVVLFSWPSAESIVRYGTDIRNIYRTVPVFARFLRLLGKHSNAEKINLLAYSAGATLATEGLALLGRDACATDRQACRDSLRLGAVYFAAPDTDFDAWVDEYRSYHDLVDSVTVTFNHTDAVLAIAQEDRRWKAYGGWEDVIQGSTTKSRLGRPDTDDISRNDLDWLAAQSTTGNLDVINIDPVGIPGLNRGDHDFWYNSPWVSTDALLALNLHARPEDRGLLESRDRSGVRIWHFPPDYERRVAVAIGQMDRKYERLRRQSNPPHP